MSILGPLILAAFGVANGAETASNARPSSSHFGFAGRAKSSELIYVSQYYSNRVDIYNSKGTLVGALKHVHGPTGLGVDSSGNLYVGACSTNSLQCGGGLPDLRWQTSPKPSDVILVYKRGATEPFETLVEPNANDLGNVLNVVVGPTGTVYVSNFESTTMGVANGTIEVFAAGNTQPSTTLSLPAQYQAGWMAIDPTGNLFVPGSLELASPTMATVFEFKAGKRSAIDLKYERYGNGQDFGAVALDPSENVLYQVFPTGSPSTPVSTIYIFPPGSNVPSGSFTEPTGDNSWMWFSPFILANGSIFGLNQLGYNVAVLGYPSGTLLRTIQQGMSPWSYPDGLAVDPGP